MPCSDSDDCIATAECHLGQCRCKTGYIGDGAKCRGKEHRQKKLYLRCLCTFGHLLQSLLTIIADVDLHFIHESELPVCGTRDLNLDRQFEMRGC